MTININIENAAAETAQSCSKDSTVAGDALMLYTKVATTMSLVLCALLASGFVTILRAIRAMHADLVTTGRTGVSAEISAILEDDTESVSPHTELASGLQADPIAMPDSTGEAAMLRTWREMGNVTIAWLGHSLSATATTITGMIPGFIPDATSFNQGG